MYITIIGGKTLSVNLVELNNGELVYGEKEEIKEYCEQKETGVETWINSDTSFINGLELNGQYGWENGLYVATNLTFTSS